jgi:hypothetical protein
MKHLVDMDSTGRRYFEEDTKSLWNQDFLASGRSTGLAQKTREERYDHYFPHKQAPPTKMMTCSFSFLIIQTSQMLREIVVICQAPGARLQNSGDSRTMKGGSRL